MRKLYLTLLTVCATLVAQGAHLTAEQALERALSSTGPLRAKQVKTTQLRQTKVYGNNFYVFNRAEGSGFLITSADDRLRPVLGYSDTGVIDVENMSPELKYWLGEYDREAEALMPLPSLTAVGIGAEQAPLKANAITDNYAKWAPVSPLVKTKWNQTAPYNDACPLYKNSSDYGRCITGCVATAMAQVVYYNQYYVGSGQKAYRPPFWNVGDSVAFDYENTPMDFAAMKATYTTGDSGTPAGEAVATLMKACGVGVDMAYSPSASSAFSTAIPNALVTYFGYDAAGTNYFDRRSYTTSDFEAIIYNELSNARPVVFSGSSANGGHSFVVDGYSDNGMFHVNWGWGGSSDGYFALTALNPYDQGVGSSEGGYNYWQNIVTVTKPGAENVHEAFGIRGAITAPSPNKFQLIYEYGQPLNGMGYTSGVLIENRYGGYSAVTWGSSTIRAGATSYWTAGDVTLRGYTPGVYKVYAAYKLEGENSFSIVPPMNGKSNYLLMTIEADGSTHTFTDLTPKIEVHASGPQGQQIYAAKGGNISMTLTNTGTVEYNGTLGVQITGEGITKKLELSGSTALNNKYSTPVVIPVDQCMQIKFPISRNMLPAGKYSLQLMTSGTTPAADEVIEFDVLEGEGASVEPLNNTVTVVDETRIKELWMKGETWTHNLSIKSTGSCNARFAVYFYEKGTDNVKQSFIMSGNRYWVIGTGTYGIGNWDSFNLNLPFGTYDVVYYIFPYTDQSNHLNYQASHRRTIRIGAEVDGYTVAPDASGTGVTILSAPGGNVTIPDTFILSDKAFPVTELQEELYRYNKELRSIVIPATVNKIGTYAFAGCTNLEYAVINNPKPVFDYVQIIAQSSNADCVWYVPQGAYDAYAPAFAARKLYEIPTALPNDTAYIEKGETTAIYPFAVAGHYNYSLTSNLTSVASVDSNCKVTGKAAGEATLTVSTPPPFADTWTTTVNVYNPITTNVTDLYDLATGMSDADYVPTVTKTGVRSKQTYVIPNELHVFDRQGDYLMVSDCAFNNERMHGFKLTGVDSSVNAGMTFTAKGRILTENGITSLDVTSVTPKANKADPVYMTIPSNEFNAAEWLYTYARLMYVYFDAATNTLSGFGKKNTKGRAVAGNESIPVRNLNNVALPESERYNPVGYIDMDSNGKYFFVPTQDFGDVSTGYTDTTDAPVIQSDYNQVTITAPDSDAVIYYTLDGSTPTEESYDYRFPIDLDATTTVSAIAVVNGKSSGVTTLVCEYVSVPTAQWSTVSQKPGYAQTDELTTETSFPLSNLHGGVLFTLSAPQGDILWYSLTQEGGDSDVTAKSIALTAVDGGVANDILVQTDGRLTFYSQNPDTKKYSNIREVIFSGQTGVETISPDNLADAVLYNLHGQPVVAPTQGIYLRRRGNTVTKVIVR